MSRTIQWSKNAHFGGGYGHTRDEDNKAVIAAKGYIDQAWEVATKPEEFKREDVQKAANILHLNSQHSMAEKCERFLSSNAPQQKED